MRFLINVLLWNKTLHRSLYSIVMTQGIERCTFDFSGMSGLKVISIFARKSTAFISFVTPAMSEYYILRPALLRHIFSTYKMLQIEPKRAFIAQMV